MLVIAGVVVSGALLAALVPAPPVAPPHPSPRDDLRCVLPLAVLPAVTAPSLQTQPPRPESRCPAPDPRPPVLCVLPVDLPDTVVVPRDCPRGFPSPDGRVVPVADLSP